MNSRTRFATLLTGFLLAVGLALGTGFWLSDGAPAKRHSDLLFSPAADLSLQAAGEPLVPLDSRLQPNSERAALGRLLFFDTRLAHDHSLSCASCHPPERGGMDGRALSVGVDGVPALVNTPSLLSASLNGRQFWDGRSATLEEALLDHLTDPRVMSADLPSLINRLSADASLADTFARLHAAGLTAQTLASTLAQYLASLPQPSRFDRWLLGDFNAISSDEATGYLLFKQYGCSGCHQGVNVGGNLFQRMGVMANYFADRPNIGKGDLGRFNVTRTEDDRHVFRVPSLRNVALSAPYFHDASALRLTDAVRLMGRYQLGVELPERDVALLVDFLDTLTSEAAP